MGEEPFRIAGRAEIEPLDRLHPGVAQHALVQGPQVEVAALEGFGAEARSILVRDLVSDLVAARPDSRADDRCQPTAQRGDSCLDDALQQPETSRVQESE